MLDIHPAVDLILARRDQVPDSESLLVAVSGIDASGKGYTTKLLVDSLKEKGLKAVGINLDGWLNLPVTRFSRDWRSTIRAGISIATHSGSMRCFIS